MRKRSKTKWDKTKSRMMSAEWWVVVCCCGDQSNREAEQEKRENDITQIDIK
jgi:hypothetical protein